MIAVIVPAHDEKDHIYACLIAWRHTLAAISSAPYHQRHIEGAGTAESAWQAWLHLGAVATTVLHEYLPSNARLVVIAPHPDDEILACGGLIAMHHDQGGDIAIIAVTDGEASHGNPQQPHNQALAATRCAESAAGLQQLGLTNVAVSRFVMPDGLVARQIMRLARRLQLLLRSTDVALGKSWRFVCTVASATPFAFKPASASS